MKKIFIFYFLIVLLNACTQQSKSEKAIINPKNFVEKDVLLSDFGNDIKYVPLDSSVIFSKIHYLEVKNKLFFIGANPKKGLLIYDQTGKFQRRIGKIGRGPGEYEYGTCFSVDSKNKRIYILERKKILVYSFDGKFIRKICLEKFDGNFADIKYLMNKLYLFEYITYGHAKYNWLVTDTLGNYNYSKLNSIAPFKSKMGFEKEAQILNNKIYYWNYYNDTIFEIQDNKNQAAYFFSKGDFRLPHGFIKWENAHKYFWPASFVETKSYQFLYSTLDKYQVLSYLDKTKNNSYIINKVRNIDIDLFINPGIINDIDAGLSFSPLWYFQEDNEEYLVNRIDAFQLKAHVASDKFKNAKPNYPKKKKELENLANSLNENDNPILMLVKLKD